MHLRDDSTSVFMSVRKREAYSAHLLQFKSRRFDMNSRFIPNLRNRQGNSPDHHGRETCPCETQVQDVSCVTAHVPEEQENLLESPWPRPQVRPLQKGKASERRVSEVKSLVGRQKRQTSSSNDSSCN